MNEMKLKIRDSELKYMFDNSGLPKVYYEPFSLVPEEVDYDSYEYLDTVKKDIRDFVKSGQQLYLYSPGYGNGKTSWSIKLMQNYFDSVWEGNGYKQRGIFLHVPTFLLNLKRNISNPSKEFEKLINGIDSVDLVIWDDIASARLSEYDFNIILSHIDQRLLHKRCNIYTGNVIGKQLEDILGSRLSSRVGESSHVVKFVGGDRRASNKWSRK